MLWILCEFFPYIISIIYLQCFFVFSKYNKKYNFRIVIWRGMSCLYGHKSITLHIICRENSCPRYTYSSPLSTTGIGSVRIRGTDLYYGKVYYESWQNYRTGTVWTNILGRSLMIGWRKNSWNPERVPSVVTFVCVCLCVCLSVCAQATGHTFWPRNLIFGLNDPWNMRKKHLLYFSKFPFSRFLWTFFDLFPI